jgi:subtilase family serine protease
MSIIKTSAGSGFAALAGIPAAQAALTPTDLRKAYKLVTISPRSGRGRIVGIVDAFNDPHAEADLKVYRSHFHLPPCTKSNGCLRILNEHGKSSPLPRANPGWALEESLDLDMVSAICPLCHITLIESSTPPTPTWASPRTPRSPGAPGTSPTAGAT